MTARAGLLIAMMVLPAGVWAQTAPAEPAAPARTPSSAGATAEQASEAELPVSLDRIREGLERPDTLARAAARADRPTFRVDIEGKLPSFAEFIGEGESLSGPAPYGGMTHNEFLSMVTPPQVRSFGASTNGDLLQVLATSLLSALAVQGASSAIARIPSFIRSARERAAREEVRQVLAELERRQAEARAREEAAEAERKKAIEAGRVREKN